MNPERIEAAVAYARDHVGVTISRNKMEKIIGAWLGDTPVYEFEDCIEIHERQMAEGESDES